MVQCYFCGDIYECGRTKILTSKTSGCIKTFLAKWLGLSKERESIAGGMSHCKTSKCPKQQSIALWKKTASRCLSAFSHPGEILAPEDTPEGGHICWFFIFETTTFVFSTSPNSGCFLCPLLLFPLPGRAGEPQGADTTAPPPWCCLLVLQHALGLCCLQKGTDKDRAAVPTPPRGQQGGTTDLWQTQEAALGQMSTVGLELQQEVLQ